MRSRSFSRFFIPVLLICIFHSGINAQMLKSIVYDFDGLTTGESDLPEGDFSNGDLKYAVAANPLSANDMVGDRCLKLNLNWNAGAGSFGRGIARYIEFDPTADQFHFFFYNPAYNNQNAKIEVIITDDDNQNIIFEAGADDQWKKDFNIAPAPGWQLFSVPLKDFYDANAGGNGVFDMAFTNNKGALLSVEFKFLRDGNAQNAEFFLDMICFSEGGLPHGNTVLDLPSKRPEDYCLLGAFTNEAQHQYHLTAAKFESYFPAVPGKRIRYVNTFLHWAYGSSTTPSEMPGASAQTLLNNGYTPVLTWEPMFAGYARLDPVQPRLQNLLNGEYNSYIDAFADEIKKLSDTVIIRFMHEFEGDWYPWSICKNGNDPQKYIDVFRMVVNRFRARGAGNAKWMWCVNSDYAPYEYYNWIVKAYPGDQYVDIVATDIYNNHYPHELPWWRSFRWQTVESYYYLTKYIPNKPLYICEVGCRERKPGEDPASESKGAWYARMDKELQSNFRKTRALIFFNANPDQVWVVNSSPGALQSLTDNIWSDDYYFRQASPTPTGNGKKEETTDLFVFPNPATSEVMYGFVSSSQKEDYLLRVFNSAGKLVYSVAQPGASNSFSGKVDMHGWPRGIYYLELSVSNPDENNSKKPLRQCQKISLVSDL